MTDHTPTRLDHLPIPENTGEIRVFMNIHNELSRLPAILAHYRALGVHRFFCIDDNSTDGTRDYLLAQPDCHLFARVTPYNEARSGILWRATLLDRYGIAHWCLNIDADELFIYPHCETVSLPKLCAWLEREGSEGMFTFMMDMYPIGRMEDAVCVPGKSFFEICPGFDRDYTFMNRIYLRGSKPFPPLEVMGGPRERCFYPDQGTRNPARRMAIHLYERGAVALKKANIIKGFRSYKSPALFKVPLVRWEKGREYKASTHVITPLKLSPVTGVLAHFKFFADFHERVFDAIKKGQHSNGAAEYKRYFARISAVGNLCYEGTMTYRTSDDVLVCGHMKTTPDFDRYAAEEESS